MAVDISHALQFQEDSIGQHNGTAEFFRIATSFWPIPQFPRPVRPTAGSYGYQTEGAKPMVGTSDPFLHTLF